MGAGQSLEDYQSSHKLGAKTKMTETACFDFRQDFGTESRRHSDHSLVAARGKGGGGGGSNWGIQPWQLTNQTAVPNFRLDNDWSSGESSHNVSRDTSRKSSSEIPEDHPAFLPTTGRSGNRWSSSSSTSTSSSSSTDSHCSSLMMVHGDDGYVDLTSGVQTWSRKKLDKRNSFNEKDGLWGGEPSNKYKRTFFNT